MFYPKVTTIVIIVALILVGIYDILQTKNTILRNFPIVGHMRFLLQDIAPPIRQYFLETDTDGKPFSRLQRNYVHAKAELTNSKHPFGTEHDLQREDIDWLEHSIYPKPKLKEPPRVLIGGENCKQPYSASLFNISAMSYGSLSKNAIQALNLGAKAGGFYHNSGEGSVSPYHLMGGDVVYQIGTGYFGCRADDGNFSPEKFLETVKHPEIKMIELKLSQGAKPGHGGILPAKKNNDEIAKIRGVKPFTEVDSPPGHKAFSSPQGLLNFIQQLRDLSGGLPVGFKLCVGSRKEFRDICEAMLKTGIKPDFITVDGAEGGTGAAPIIFSDHVGMPWGNALVFVVDTLKEYKLKKDIKVITSGKLITAFDIFKALCLGADLCNSARGMMLALGCIQALECHLNTCPTGIATNDPRKMRGLVVENKWKRVKNYQEKTLDEFLDLLAAAGCTDVNELNRSFISRQHNFEVKGFEDYYPADIPLKDYHN